MKKVLWKELGRAVWRTKTRFLSILAIIAVGTGFFAGVKVSCPDMKLTAQKYFEDNRLMDLHLVSTLGFSEEDLAAVRDAGGIRGMMPSYSADAFVDTGEGQSMLVKALSLPETREGEDYLNRPVLKEGRLPEKADECVVDSNAFSSAAELFQVGKQVTFYREEGTDINDMLAADTFTIVGIVESPSYISFTRGNSLIGDGEIDAFVLLPEEAFSLEVYTDVYLTLDSTKGISPFDSAYDELVEEKSAALEQIADVRAEARYNEIVDEAQAELDKAKAELADGEKKAEEELSAARKQLKEAEQKLADGQKAYEEGLLTFETEIADAERLLEDGKQKLADGRQEYEAGRREYEAGLAEFEAQKPAALEEIAGYEEQAQALRAQLEEGRAALEGARQTVAGIEGLLTAYEATAASDPLPAEVQAVIDAAARLEDSLGETGQMSLSAALTAYVRTDPAANPQQKALLKAGISAAIPQINNELAKQEAQLAEGEAGLKALEDGIAAGKQGLAAAEQALTESKKALEAALTELEAGETELAEQGALLATKKAEGQAELDSAKQELADGKAEYEKGLKEYNDGKAESDKKLADARQQIKDAENELAALAEPTWYVWDRDNNPGYSGYQEDAEKVDAIAQVFPVFFVLVAALVCLTTMTRMVEEERTQIGTLKALGYGRRSIMMKYLMYAVLASLVGSAVGLTVGFQLFPRVIINAYGIMYIMPDPLTPFRWDYAAVCTLVAVLCTGLSALAACYKGLRSCPAQLMRPRAPKNGKRVLLERVHFIWNRLSFIHKVTLRNIFRYKRRAAMTIIGVAGCTALLLTGFGMRYSITSIADKQYGSIFVYDAVAMAEDKVDDMAGLREKLSSNTAITQALGLTSKTLDATHNGVVRSVSLYVPEDPAGLADYIKLRERFGGKELSLTGEGVVITEKLSKLLGAGEGDTITLNNPDGRPIEVRVTGVTENYAMHFVYMTPELYEELFRTAPVVNTFLMNLADGVDTSALSEELLGYGGLLGVSYSSDGLSSFTDMMSSLDSIVWVLIISAGALAFIVMYNLVNINVNERVRELATIKVLGFYDKEVSAYIYRENNIAAACGLGLGLVLGIFLERFVIVTAEVDAVMFSPEISLPCYLYAALLTVLFTVIVNITLHFQLKRISMVESLKSVE